MNNKRTTLAIVALGITAIVVVAFIVFAGKVATREYNKATTPMATSHFEDTSAK